MNSRKIIALIGMLVLGALGFWGLAALVDFRTGRPIASPGQSSAGARRPFEVLRGGIESSLRSAVAALDQHQRSDAVAAMDAAKRAAEVARDAAGAEFEDIFQSVKRARLALQDGDTAGARQFLTKAAGRLSASAPHEPFQDRSLAGYQGATVLNANGVRIGEVKEASGERAKIIVGKKRDLLGFIDLSGGRELDLSRGDLVLGKRKTLGSTLVLLPTYSTKPDQIADGATRRLSSRLRLD